MNAGYNHGSQGDFFSKALEDEEPPKVKPASSAPEGVGADIRETARVGDYIKLKGLLEKWKGDSVINEGDDIGTTPLHTAVSNDHKECVELLLSCGADKELKNCYGQTPYSKAKTAEIRALVKPDAQGPESFCLIM